MWVGLADPDWCACAQVDLLVSMCPHQRERERESACMMACAHARAEACRGWGACCWCCACRGERVSKLQKMLKEARQQCAVAKATVHAHVAWTRTRARIGAHERTRTCARAHMHQ